MRHLIDDKEREHILTNLRLHMKILRREREKLADDDKSSKAQIDNLILDNIKAQDFLVNAQPELEPVTFDDEAFIETNRTCDCEDCWCYDYNYGVVRCRCGAFAINYSAQELDDIKVGMVFRCSSCTSSYVVVWCEAGEGCVNVKLGTVKR